LIGIKCSNNSRNRESESHTAPRRGSYARGPEDCRVDGCCWPRATYKRLHNGALLSAAAGGGQRLLGRQWHATDSGTASGSVAGAGSIMRDAIRRKMEVEDKFIKWHLRLCHVLKAVLLHGRNLLHLSPRFVSVSVFFFFFIALLAHE
jgi:hypothetical protein